MSTTTTSVYTVNRWLQGSNPVLSTGPVQSSNMKHVAECEAHLEAASDWSKGVPACLACSCVMQDMEWLRRRAVGPDSTTSDPSMPCWVTPCWHCHSEMAAHAYLQTNPPVTLHKLITALYVCVDTAGVQALMAL